MIDARTIHRYNVQAPRYTSYPTALQFSEVDHMEGPLAYIREHNRFPRNISLYIHLPFCASLCWFCGCTKVISRKQESSREYLEYLDRELRLTRPLIHPESRVVQVHLGGGTPTFLTADELKWLGERLHQDFHMADDVEMGVEIDPRRLSGEQVAALAENGFNRVALGIQDFDPRVQEAINRIQPIEQVERVIGWLREAGFHSLNFDLLYGLPRQDRQTNRHTLKEVLRLTPDRLAVYSYAHVPWIKPAQKLLDRYPMPDTEEKFRMLEQIHATLTEGGYEAIGMDHFARPGDELAVAQREGTLQRNFQGYSTRANTDLYAIGMSGISHIGNMYLQNRKELPDYYNALDNGTPPFFKQYMLSEDDCIRRETIMQLMCNMKLDLDALSHDLNIDAAHYFADELVRLRRFDEDGFIDWHDSGFTVSRKGRYFIRNIAMTFDAYLTSEPEQPRFSKSV